MSSVLIPISPGELIDKLTILQIKRERITDAAKLVNVERELALLIAARDRFVPPSDVLSDLASKLKQINQRLWDVEDNLRLCEGASDFGPRFVELARSVYRHNDIRCALKRQVNEALGSELIEEKEYRLA